MNKDLYTEQNKKDYEYIKNQNRVYHKHFNKATKILLIADISYGMADGLNEYFNTVKNCNSKVAYNYSEAMDFILRNKFDILIFVGIQENEEIYKLTHPFKKHNKKAVVVFYIEVAENTISSKDLPGEIPDMEVKIGLNKPLDKLCLYLQEVKNKEIEKQKNQLYKWLIACFNCSGCIYI